MTFTVFLLLPWQPESCIDSKSLNNFQAVLPKYQSCEIWLKQAQVMLFNVVVD